MGEEGPVRRRRSQFKLTSTKIARRLEGTRGPKKYAGKDGIYQHGEAEESARKISASIGRKSIGQRAMTRRSVAARRRNR